MSKELLLEVQALKDIIKQRKIRYRELSEKSGVPLQTIRALFSGQIRVPTIWLYNSLCRAVGCVPTTPQEMILVSSFRQLSAENQSLVLQLVQRLNNNE